MPESSLLALIVVSLGVVAWWLIRGWVKRWETHLTAHDERLDVHDEKHTRHDVNHAVLKANLEHIRATSDATAKDVKELLKQNGQRSTG